MIQTLKTRRSILSLVVVLVVVSSARATPAHDARVAALRATLARGGIELVFCRMDGAMMNSGEIKWQASRLAPDRLDVLRYTFASHLVMRGAPLKAVQELLGHATITMTMRYAHLAPEIAREAVKLLDARGKTVAKTAASC